MTVKIKREDMTASELRQQAGRVKDGRVSRRLLAIALVFEGASRTRAAESCGMDRQTLRDWVHRYNDEGIEGLCNRGGGGAKPLLSDDQMSQLANWVEDGPDPAQDGVVRWRRADLARRIEAKFAIKIHERTVGTYLAKLGFRRLSVRPEHPKADPAAQEAFKKTSLEL
jgi:transposase